MKSILFPMALATALALNAADIAEIRSIMAGRVENGKAMGIVAGIIDAQGRQVLAAGKIAADQPGQPDGDTIYEIGSITKVFTSLVLADMIEKGEVKPDDPVSKYLPASVKMPSRNGREITLLDISTQTSGLPRLPNNLKPADVTNPYADYDAAKLYKFLSGYTLTRDPGEKYEYSNLAVGLLGHVLALRAGMSYEELLRRRIFEPLGMTSTTITLSDAQKRRLAPGYSVQLRPVKNWDFDVLAGCGAVRSTVNDMLKFVAANLELTDTPLKAAMRRMRSVSKPTGMPDIEIAMAWHIFTKYDRRIYWHNGGTFGYRSFMGFDPEKKQGVVILCNTFTDNDDLGRHILESRYEAAAIHKEIPLDAAVIERYVGEYELTPTFKLTVTRDGTSLYAKATGQSRLEIYPEAENKFFYKIIDAQIIFDKDGLTLHQDGEDRKAKKTK